MAYNVSSQWWPLWCRRELCGHCSVAPLVWGQGEVLDSFQLPWGGDYPSFSSFPIPFPSYSLISVIVLGKQCIEWWSRKYSCVPYSSSSRLEYFTAKSTDAWVLEHGSGGLVGVLSRAASFLQVSRDLSSGLCWRGRKMEECASLSGSQEGALYVYKLICHWLLLSISVFSDFSQHFLVIG